jgi:hypothetical protein
LRRRRDRPRRRRLVHRTRSGLRNNHARRWRLRRCGSRRWRNRPRRRSRRLRCCRCCSRRRWRRRRSGRRNRARRCGNCRSGGGWRHWRSRLLCRRSDHCGSRRGRCNCGRRGRRSRRWRRLYWRHSHRLSRHRRRRGPSRGRRCLLLLRDGFEHISRPRDVRQIDLGLDFFFAAQRAGRSGRRRLRFRRAADVGPYFFRFMLLERTGMGLLLRHPDDR